MWLSAVKLALNAGTHIYKKRQETKMAMADAQHMHAAKMVQNREITDDKLEQNEELANLRADTAIEKQEMANESREKLARMKPRGN